MSSPAASTLAALRRRLAAIEPANASFAQTRPTGPGEGPLRCCGPLVLAGALHEVAAARESETAAATAFVLPLAAFAAQARSTLWIAEDMALAESGVPYGGGLDAFGLAPERLVRVAVAHARDVLWVMEEALRCRAVGAVIGEIRGGGGRGDVGLTASRRLSLAAGRESAAAFLLRTAPVREPVAAATRWIAGAAPSVPDACDLGPPRLNVRLTRNRQGRPGAWLLEWNRADRRFDLATADRQPLAETA
jgi:protein ImuA